MRQDVGESCVPGSGPGSAVASSLVRDRWTTAGARSLDPRRGGGVLACQTFDRGPRCAGVLARDCLSNVVAPFSGPTPGPGDVRGPRLRLCDRDLWANRGGPGLGRKLRAGCLIKSAVRQLAGPGRLTKHGGPVLAQTDVWSGTCVLGVWLSPRAPVRWSGTLTKRSSPSPGQTP